MPYEIVELSKLRLGFSSEMKQVIHQEEIAKQGFVYTLIIHSTNKDEQRLHTMSQGRGYWCTWRIENGSSLTSNEIKVTDDSCEVIVFSTLDKAKVGARLFLSI